MSDSAVDYNQREQIARIDQMREDAVKLMVEQHKLTWEALKLEAEQRKLYEEAFKLRRDRWLLLLSLLGTAGGLLTVLHALRIF